MSESVADEDSRGVGPSVGCVADGLGSVGLAPLLLTPAQAAGLLQVRESWLRRRAAERRVPCSFVGKHLRFSHADVEAIVTAGARPVRVSQRGQSRPAPRRGAGDRSPARWG